MAVPFPFPFGATMTVYVRGNAAVHAWTRQAVTNYSPEHTAERLCIHLERDVVVSCAQLCDLRNDGPIPSGNGIHGTHALRQFGRLRL